MGGVTMHVHRLLKRLIEPQVVNYELCDYKAESFITQLRKIYNAGVMHIHASSPYLKLLYVLAGKILRTKSLMTVHGRYGVFTPLKNFVNKLALKWCDIPILINRESYEDVLMFNENAVFIPAFLPPIDEEETLSSTMLENILQIKKEGKPLVVSNATSRAFTDDGREIYGIDFLINYFRCHPEYNFVILDPSNNYFPLYEKSLPKNIHIYTGKNSFYGLVKYADVVIRNTPIDGDSLSVKEALFLHKPTLATDAVSRPVGVFLFKYNDESSIDKTIRDSLSYKGEIALKEKDATDTYYKLYRRVEVL